MNAIFVRALEVNRFKEVFEFFFKLIGLLFLFIELKSYATGSKTFSESNYNVIVGSTIMLWLFFTMVMLGTLLPHDVRNPVPALIVLIIGAVVSILLSSLIFLTISWIAFVAWFIVFATLVYLEHKSI